MQIPGVARTEHNGVLTYTTDPTDILTGQLMFGVGRRDETAISAGTAHLVVLIVLERLGALSESCDWVVTDELIVFSSSGSPQKVAGVLNSVAEAVTCLRESTDDEVAAVKNAMAELLGVRGRFLGRGAFVDRFGVKNFGLVDFGFPAFDSLKRDDVSAFAEHWLHSGNAALAFTGTVPEELSVSLPPAHPMPPREEVFVEGGGTWNLMGEDSLVLTLEMNSSRSPAVTLLTQNLVTDALCTELCENLEIANDVEIHPAIIDVGQRVCLYWVDAAPQSVVGAAEASLGLLRSLASIGPSLEQLDRTVIAFAAMIADPDARSDLLLALAEAVLRGRRASDDLAFADWAAVSTEEVRELLASAVSGVTVNFDEETLGGSDIDEISSRLRLRFAGEKLVLHSLPTRSRQKRDSRAVVFRPRTGHGSAGDSISVGRERILVRRNDWFAEFPFDQLAIALRYIENGMWGLACRCGEMTYIEPDSWRGAKKLDALLTERLPRDKQRNVELAPV